MITRDNYDEFFMMYADGELSAADRQAVDRFVMENPDLAEELALYHQMQLPADELSFTGKSSLYRFEAEDITAANHEEQFLLYVDDELDKASREKVEVFVLQNPAYQESFTVLKQTKLPVETVVFADKASLYRKEERRPVAFMRWGRMAAAAALIGLAVLVWVLVPADRTPNMELAKRNAGSNAVTAPGNTTEKQPVNSIQEPGAENNANTTASVNAVNSKAKIPGVQQEVPGTTINEQPVQDNVIAYNPVTNPPVENKGTTIVTGNTANEGTTSTDRTFAGNGSSQSTDVKNAVEHTDEQTQTAVVHQAVYKELDTDDEKKSLYLGSLEINKDKLRGFFRKAGSIFRGKSKQEEDNKTETATQVGTRTLK